MAFRIRFADLGRAGEWPRARGIEPRADPGFGGHEPTVRPRDGSGALCFDDPDGNSPELLCNLPGERRDWDRMYPSEREAHVAAEGQGGIAWTARPTPSRSWRPSGTSQPR